MIGYKQVFNIQVNRNRLVHAGINACAAAGLALSFPAHGADKRQAIEPGLIIAQAGTYSSRGTAGSRLATDPAGTRSVPSGNLMRGGNANQVQSRQRGVIHPHRSGRQNYRIDCTPHNDQSNGRTNRGSRHPLCDRIQN